MNEHHRHRLDRIARELGELALGHTDLSPTERTEYLFVSALIDGILDADKRGMVEDYTRHMQEYRMSQSFLAYRN